MSTGINKKYAEKLIEIGFRQSVATGYTVAFENENSGEHVYLSRTKAKDNKSIIIHPGYEYAINELTKHPGIVFRPQKEKYFHDSSLSEFPRRLYDSNSSIGSHYGLEIMLSNADQIQFLLNSMGGSKCKTAVDLDLEDFLENNPDLSVTERKIYVSSRIGQGVWRAKLDKYWKGCCLTGCTIRAMLVGSHIKPWNESTNIEKLDPQNGLLLRSDIDALFDASLLSFDDDGKIVLSDVITQEEIDMLPFDLDLRVEGIKSTHKMYLSKHRQSLKQL